MDQPPYLFGGWTTCIRAGSSWDMALSLLEQMLVPSSSHWQGGFSPGGMRGVLWGQNKK